MTRLQGFSWVSGAALAVALVSAPKAAEVRRELLESEMREVRAGLSVSSFSPSANQNVGRDNEIIDFRFTSVFPSTTVLMQARAGSSKVAGAIVATDSAGAGRFRARSTLPLGRRFDLAGFYCNPNSG